MRRSTGPRARIALGCLAILALLVVSVLVGAAGAAPRPPAAPSTSASVGSAATFNAPCAPVMNGIVVCLANKTEPDIIPAPGTDTASVEPSAKTSLPLVVRSTIPLNGSSSASARSGVDAPVALNVTGTLWNGVPYYTPFDGTTYHSATPAWWDGPIPNQGNTTFPWWYLVNISSVGQEGQPLFFPGMAITWWIAITFNVSGVYEHEPILYTYHFTYDGAWPYSPYQGVPQYDGAASYGKDVTSTIVPGQPNWNDSVTLGLLTNPLDQVDNTTIGQAYVDITETALNGSVLATQTLVIASANGTGSGVPALHFKIPATFAQQAGAKVALVIHVADAWNDWIQSPLVTYKVGGNGSFAVGQFGDDLSLASFPRGPPLLVAPGQAVSLYLNSTNLKTAIGSAVVFYSVHLPILNTVTSTSARFQRLNSTAFQGTIPGMPLGAGVNFTVEAWDFNSTGEVSQNFNYSVETLAEVLPAIAANGSFFYVAVHDANHGWVSGAEVTVLGPGGFFRSVGFTLDGLAYPNATTGPLVPVVVPAGETYVVNVTDRAFFPAGATLAPSVKVNLSVTHGMDQHVVLATTNDYEILENGNVILFWLNATAPSPASTPSDNTPVLIGSIAALAGVALVAVPLILWYRQIEKRREEETKRVTL